MATYKYGELAVLCIIGALFLLFTVSVAYAIEQAIGPEAFEAITDIIYYSKYGNSLSILDLLD